MKEPVKTEIYRGMTINIFYDEGCQSPDNWENTDAFLVYDHRDFCVERNGFDPTEIWEHFQENGTVLYDGYYAFKVYALIHSGVSLSLGSHFGGCDPGGWDTSMKGFLMVKKQKHTYSSDKAEKLAQLIINAWNDSLSGNVYGFDVEETGDSCWGFYGDIDKNGILEEAKADIDATIRHKFKKRSKYLKRIIRSRVPLIYRKGFSI